MEPVTATFRWDRREHARVAQRLFLDRLRSPLLGIPIAAVLVFWALLVTLDVWRAVTTGSLLPIWESAVLILLGLAVVLLLAFGFGRLQAWILARSDPRLSQPMTNTIDAQGVAVDTNAGRSFLPWSGMPRVVETDECFLW